MNKQIFNKMKETKGITMVALIVTITVLLILASITIATLTRRKWSYNKCYTC